jgi:hypothetical protein
MIETALRLAAAIVCDFLALAIWNIGTRPPAQLIADIRSGVRSRATFMRGLAALVWGTLLLLVGAIAVSPTVRASVLSLVEIYTVIAALVLEQLLGEELRARFTFLRR